MPSHPRIAFRLVIPLGALLTSLLLIDRAGAQVTMSDLWPNEDGRSWWYAQEYHDLLDGTVIENHARMYFHGTDTVPGGIVVQNLVVEAPVGARPAGTENRLARAVSMPQVVTGDPLLSKLWIARPDLRAAIEAKARALASPSGASGAAGYGTEWYQVLLHEAAYRKTDEDIAAYRRDQNAMKSWLWLVADLEIGNTFALQLVPDLDDDVWLYGTNAAWEDVQVPAGVFPGCLRVDYRIDYGESICTSEQGEETGAFKSETSGYVHYAPYHGPIDQYEEFIPIVEMLWGECPAMEQLGIDPGEVITYGSLQLLGDQPTAIRMGSWGSVRAGFRGR